MWDLAEPSPNGPLTDEMVVEAETILGVSLPADYIAALRQKNGGLVVGNYFRLPHQHIPSHLRGFVDHGYICIADINGIGRTHISVLETPYMTEEWRLPKGFVLLDGDGHTWTAFDYRTAKSNPTVVYLDAESGDTLFVADNFSQFFVSLVRHEALFDDKGAFIGPSSPRRP